MSGLASFWVWVSSVKQKDYQLQVSEELYWDEIVKEKEREGEGGRKVRGGKKEHVSM